MTALERDLTDDELTELECALIDACDEAVRRGLRIAHAAWQTTGEYWCCPFGALLGPGARFPGPRQVAHLVPVGFTTARFTFGAFLNGLSGNQGRLGTDAGCQMGLRFRARYILKTEET